MEMDKELKTEVNSRSLCKMLKLSSKKLPMKLMLPFIVKTKIL